MPPALSHPLSLYLSPLAQPHAGTLFGGRPYHAVALTQISVLLNATVTLPSLDGASTAVAAALRALALGQATLVIINR